MGYREQPGSDWLFPPLNPSLQCLSATLPNPQIPTRVTVKNLLGVMFVAPLIDHFPLSSNRYQERHRGNVSKPKFAAPDVPPRAEFNLGDIQDDLKQLLSSFLEAKIPLGVDESYGLSLGKNAQTYTFKQFQPIQCFSQVLSVPLIKYLYYNHQRVKERMQILFTLFLYTFVSLFILLLF